MSMLEAIAEIYQKKQEMSNANKLAHVLSTLSEEELFKIANSGLTASQFSEVFLKLAQGGAMPQQMDAAQPQMGASMPQQPMPQPSPEDDQDDDLSAIIGAAVRAAADTGKRLGEGNSTLANLNSAPAPAQPTLPAPQGVPQPVASPPGGQAALEQPPATAQPTVKTAAIDLSIYYDMLRKQASLEPSYNLRRALNITGINSDRPPQPTLVELATGTPFEDTALQLDKKHQAVTEKEMKLDIARKEVDLLEKRIDIEKAKLESGLLRQLGGAAPVSSKAVAQTEPELPAEKQAVAKIRAATEWLPKPVPALIDSPLGLKIFGAVQKRANEIRKVRREKLRAPKTPTENAVLGNIAKYSSLNPYLYLSKQAAPKWAKLFRSGNLSFKARDKVQKYLGEFRPDILTIRGPNVVQRELMKKRKRTLVDSLRGTSGAVSGNIAKYSSVNPYLYLSKQAARPSWLLPAMGTLGIGGAGAGGAYVGHKRGKETGLHQGAQAGWQHGVQQGRRIGQAEVIHALKQRMKSQAG